MGGGAGRHAAGGGARSTWLFDDLLAASAAGFLPGLSRFGRGFSRSTTAAPGRALVGLPPVRSRLGRVNRHRRCTSHRLVASAPVSPPRPYRAAPGMPPSPQSPHDRRLVLAMPVAFSFASQRPVLGASARHTFDIRRSAPLDTSSARLRPVAIRIG